MGRIDGSSVGEAGEGLEPLGGVVGIFMRVGDGGAESGLGLGEKDDTTTVGTREGTVDGTEGIALL